MNKYTGEVAFKVGDKQGRLVFDWRALAELQTKYGSTVLKDLFENINPEIIADMLEIGFRKLSPEITKSVVIEASPPLIMAAKAIDKAMTYAYFGAEIPEAVENPVSPQDEDDKKKTSSLNP